MAIAQFYANRFVNCSRSTSAAGGGLAGKYCVNNIMGPENWNKQNNTAEINAFGAAALRWGLQSSAISGVPLPATAANWSHIADNVYIPFNGSLAPGGYTPAFDGSAKNTFAPLIVQWGIRIDFVCLVATPPARWHGDHAHNVKKTIFKMSGLNVYSALEVRAVQRDGVAQGRHRAMPA